MSAMARGNSFLYSSDLFIPHFLTSVLIQVLEHLLSLGSDIHHHCSVFFVVSSIAVVPNLFGIRDWYRGRQFLHGLGQEDKSFLVSVSLRETLCGFGTGPSCFAAFRGTALLGSMSFCITKIAGGEFVN